MKPFSVITLAIFAFGMAISFAETGAQSFRIRRQFGALRPSLGGGSNNNPNTNTGNNGGFGDPNYQPVYSQGGGGSPNNMQNPTSPFPDPGNNRPPPFNDQPGNNNRPPFNQNPGNSRPPTSPPYNPNVGNNIPPYSGGSNPPSYNGGSNPPSYNGGSNQPSYNNNAGNNQPSYNNGGDNTPIISIPYNPDVDFDIRPLIIEIFRPFNYDRFFNTNGYRPSTSSLGNNNNQGGGGSGSYFGGGGYNTGVPGGLNQGNRGNGGVVGYGR